ncbi:MAG: hypothetical protein ABI760_24580 [Ferruginibacter sp.]
MSIINAAFPFRPRFPFQSFCKGKKDFLSSIANATASRLGNEAPLDLPK